MGSHYSLHEVAQRVKTLMDLKLGEVGGLEKKNLDPQLHQILKPIRELFCTTGTIYHVKYIHTL